MSIRAGFPGKAISQRVRAVRGIALQGALAVVALSGGGLAALLVQHDDRKADSVQTTISEPDYRFVDNQAVNRDAALELQSMTAGDGGGGGGIAGVCSPGVVTYSSFPWINGASFMVQAGFVGDEIAAVSYTLPAAAFPVKVDLIEMLFGTSNPQQQITTEWSVLVWAGNPNTGELIAEYSSDGKILPHMVLNPPANAIHLQFLVDPNDPDQIIVPPNPSNTISVGFRIDEMNNPPTMSCNAGFTPPQCCPHNQGTNIFPTTDVGSLGQPTKNWLYAKPGCGLGSLSGWYQFSQLGLSTPSGDWNIRLTYTPSDCVPGVGSCCLPNGTCLANQTLSQCQAQDGVYQGDSTTCGTVNCPVATGACCTNGACAIKTQPDCLAGGGTFLGDGVACDANSCKGACCVQSTQNCVNFTEPNCNAVNGSFQGVGTSCTGTICFGSCCMPDGSCTDGETADSCAALGGTFNAGISCGSANCPQPTGRCCVNNNCLEKVNEADCGAVGGTWGGVGTACAGSNPCSPNECPADIAPAGSPDGAVDVDDLLAVINSWGPCAGCAADIAPPPQGDDAVNVDDLLMIINGWGACE